MTLNPLDPETEEKLREEHGIDLPGWTPKRPAAIEQEDRMVHADQLDPVRMLSGRMLEETDAEVLGEINGSLRWARWIFSEMVQDKKVPQHWRDQAELFLEDEAAQSELCWLWEHPEE